MIILGLTGSIGCGKSSLSNILRDNNINIIDYRTDDLNYIYTIILNERIY